MAATNPLMYADGWKLDSNALTFKPLWPCICCWRDTEQSVRIDNKIKECWNTCLWAALTSFLGFSGLYACGRYKEMEWPTNNVFWPGMLLTGALAGITHIANYCINKLKTI